MLLIIVAGVLAPLAAESVSMVNVGYDIHGNKYRVKDQSYSSISMNFIWGPAQGFGFYNSTNLAYGLSKKYTSGNVASFNDVNQRYFGANGLLGLAYNLDLGGFGVLFGTGVYYNVNSRMTTTTGFSMIEVLGGFGLAANGYYEVFDSFLVNAGVSFSVAPFGYLTTSNAGTYNPNNTSLQTNFNVNVGVGWVLPSLSDYFS